MKVLIIGAKGILGGALCRVFKDNEIIAWDFEDLDITKEAEVMEKISFLRPNVIINAAAYNNVDKAEEEHEKADLINGYAPGYLAKIAEDIGAELVHYSTDYIFDGKKKEGHVEDDAPNPISAYGASKLLGEQEVQNNAKNFYIIRLSRLFGRLGAGKKSFVDTMFNLSQKQDIISVINEEMSSPTYAPDAAERTRHIIESRAPFGIYHAANSGSCTWYEFAKEIFKQAEKNIELIPVSGDRFPRKALRPKYSVLLNTKLPPMRDWREALQDYLLSK